MIDFYGNEIQIGDKCILLRLNQLEQVTALDIDDYQGGRVEVCTSGGTKLIISSSDRLIDITAIKEEARKQQPFNSVKALGVKPTAMDNDTISDIVEGRGLKPLSPTK